MIFNRGPRKRRSDRLMFNIPLRVAGVTPKGTRFECRGHAVDINRFGAHIRLERPVPLTQKILLTNLENNLRGEFRIVKTLESSPAGKSEFGVEALGDYPTFWGIGFPAKPRKQGESRGLLECRQCGSVALHPLMLDEIEMLESGGTLRKTCRSCSSKTEWKFAMEGGAAALPETETEVPGGVRDAQKKPGRPTVYMQRPVSIRTASGEIDNVLTENLSKDEIRCSSEKSYEVNQVVTLEWENSGTGKRLQVRGRIRRRQSIAGSPRIVYSIRHEGTPVVLPPAPLKPSGGLYTMMGILTVAASVLLGLNVRGIVFSLVIPSGPTARRVAYLGAALLLIAVAHKAWKTIRTREPESRQIFRKRHWMAAWVMAVAFLGSLGVGVIAGAASAHQTGRKLKVLHDFAVARIFESNIDAAENRVMSSPEDYADVCATLALLAGKWRAHLDELSTDALELYRLQLWQSAESRREMKALERILALDRRKLRVVEEQIALKTEAKSLSPDQQMNFWQSNFPPLRQNIRDLDSQKNQMVKTLVPKK